MNQAIEAQPSAEYPKPGITENLSGGLTMIDGTLIFVTLMANRGDLAALALFGLAIGSITCFRFIDERRSRYQKPQNAIADDNFWEVSQS